MNYTINTTKPVIIGIDHGYGNIKTAHTCFKTGVTAYDKEPTFKSDLLIYEDRYYIIGTMNIMYINNGRPIPNKCFTEKFGTHQCMLAAREKLMQKFGVTVDDAVIEEVLRYGGADIGKQYLEVIREAATEYAGGIMRRLREHEYNPELMKLYVVGGGSCLIRNFAELDPARVTINGDICATARGYELLAQRTLGGLV